MPAKLTQKEKHAIIKALSATRKKQFISAVCSRCQSGGGIDWQEVIDIAQKILGDPTVQALGRKALVEYIIPFLKKKFKDATQSGSGIRLAGQRHPRMPVRRKTITRTCKCTS